jgi:hypothetical protein
MSDRRSPLVSDPAPSSGTPQAELGEDLGVDAGDIRVMFAALGEQVDDELTAAQAADLLDVLDAKVRLRA